MHRDNNAFTGHAWIYAPPFKIVDVSISLQRYSGEEQRYFHGYTLAEEWDEPQNFRNSHLFAHVAPDCPSRR
jgi:hypothetical protein